MAENEGHTAAMEEEMGDLIFSIVNYARFLNVDVESALERTNKKFMDRFSIMEGLGKEKELQLTDMKLAQLDALWNKAKEVQHLKNR